LVTAVTKVRRRARKLWLIVYDLRWVGKKSIHSKVWLEDRESRRARRAFYRAVQRWLRKHPNAAVLWLNYSTVVTDSQEFVDFLLKEVEGLPESSAFVFRAELQRRIGRPRYLDAGRRLYDWERVDWLSG
jgi:hypothetical protein